MELRQKKQFIIGGVYFLIIFLLSVGVYWQLKPKATCFDNVKNQNEEGIDCGGICTKKCPPVSHLTPKIKEVGFLPSGFSDQYDIYAKIENPNQSLGIKKINYIVNLKGVNEEILATGGGDVFFLPGETKYIIINNLSSSVLPVKAEITFEKNIEWVEATEQYLRPDIQAVNREYGEVVSGVGFAQAKALVRNNSQWDLSQISIAVILRDEQGKIIALNTTKMNSVLAGESREFVVNWPKRFAGTVAGPMEVQTETNIFADDAFMQKSFKTEKFQEYQ